MLFFDKDDEYEAEVKLLDLLRNHKKDQTSWSTICKRDCQVQKRETKHYHLYLFSIAVSFRITYYRRLA